MDPHVHTEYSGCYGVSGGRNRLSQQRDMDGHPDDQRRFYRKVCVELTLESGDAHQLLDSDYRHRKSERESDVSPLKFEYYRNVNDFEYSNYLSVRDAVAHASIHR
jgi:hypothetical protein